MQGGDLLAHRLACPQLRDKFHDPHEHEDERDIELPRVGQWVYECLSCGHTWKE